MLLSVAYFPPVEFFALLAENSTVYLEACEYYCKQSWRNRCRILTANGPMDLSFPVKHCGDLFHTPVSEVQVDYSVPWVRRTQYAIESAYFNSPFFIYYRDELFDILDIRPETLWELDLELIRFFCRKIGIAPELIPTSEYVKQPSGDDYREVLHPKRSNSVLSDRGLDRGYWQLFRERFGFVPGLSVMDLLFNEGPESICWIKNNS